MSATLILECDQITATELFSSKLLKRPAIQKIGHSSWRKNPDGSLTEFVYVKTPGSFKFDWVESGVHKKNVADKKRHNAQVFGPSSPKVVEKRRLKRKQDQLPNHFYHC
jgi:hypothetical protein